jgi:hypothetical protein
VYKTKLLWIFAFVSVLTLSCKNALSDTETSTRMFWAQNMANDTFYSLSADLMATGRHCTVWAEQGKASSDTARAMANAFDDDIYPKMMNAFSFEANIVSDGKTVAHNAVELADFLGDGDGKLALLLLDIKDDWTPGGSYVAGYFSWVDFYANDSFSFDYKSNLMDMIYVDIYPGQPGSTASNMTVAHEMQHMMNYVTSMLTSTRNGWAMDTWIDEGLSSAAEYIYLGAHSEERYKWFIANGATTSSGRIFGEIDKGNNFFIWGNIKSSNPLSVLDDYATVYLFFQWLRLQSGGSNDIYKSIITSPYYDYRALTSVANAAIPGKNYADWETLLKTWMAANYINASSGEYGYMNDPTLKAVTVTSAPTTADRLSLLPGEGVYSGISGALPALTPAANIKYAGLKKTGAGLVSVTPSLSDTALLSFNANTAWNGSAQLGTVTRSPVAADMARSPSMSLSAGAGSEANFSGTFRIDARDMLARNEHGPRAFSPRLNAELMGTNAPLIDTREGDGNE